MVAKSLRLLTALVQGTPRNISLESDSDHDYALRRLLEEQSLRGGKQVRVQMGHLFCQALDAETATSHSLLKAAEMLHAATLIHDDVIDHSLERRGQRALHQIVGNRHAVLAGDYLLSKVIRVVAQSGNSWAVDAIARCLEELIEGEWLQMELYENLFATKGDLERIATKKTGELFGWTCAVPAFVSEDPKLQFQLREFGEVFGLAYQMMDDILDFRFDTGKPRLQDFKERRLNFVSQAMIEAHPDLIGAWSWDQVSWTQEQEDAAIRRIVNRIEGLSLGLRHLLDAILPPGAVEKGSLELLIDELGRRAR